MAGTPYTPPPQKRLSGTKVFFITMLAVILGLLAFFFLLIMFFVSLGAIAAAGSQDTSDSVVLEIDLRKPMLDSPVQPTLLSDSPPSVVGIVQSLDRAKTDERVKGVFIRGETIGMAPASAEELRLALLDFKTSDKFVITHAQGLNSTSIIPYQAISASDEIWLQATTSVATAGLFSQSEFLGGLMDKIGAEPQFIRHGAYKNAVNSYTEEGFTPEHREATTSLLTSIFDVAVDNIAEDRGLERDQLLTLLDTAPHPARAAKTAGLIDELGYLEDVREHIYDLAGSENATFKPIEDYAPKTHYSKPVIALIEGQGTIIPGSSGGDDLFSASVNMGGETLAQALDKAADDEKVEAIIFRVSSPGGSAAASDQMMAAVKRAQEAGKPVVVSMGQYAASGGYYAAAPADHIIAMPQTITGSIGVFGGKVAFEDAFEKVGYNIESIRVGGDYAGVYNIDEPFSAQQLASYQQEMDMIYADFLQIVAEGRKMSVEEVRAVAEGRVWTGQQALEHGLVDELGGFDTALSVAKQLAEIDADSDVRIKRFPRPKTRDELINDLFSGTAETGAQLGQINRILELPEIQAALRAREAVSTEARELKAPLPDIR